MSIEIFVVGATGAVGRMMLKELERLGYSHTKIRLMASPSSAGMKLQVAGDQLTVEPFSLEEITPSSFVLLSAGGSFSRQYAQAMTERGATVVDNSSAWRMTPDIPLVVPEVNAQLLKDWSGAGIIANPNCSTIQLVVSLAPLKAAFGLEAVNVVTFQSVSGAGQKGIEDLEAQLSGKPPSHLPRPIVGNIIPAIDVLDEYGHCFEEEKICRETKKILNDENINVLATTARVPTKIGHCEAVSLKLGQEATYEELRQCFKNAPGVSLVTATGYSDFPTLSQWEGRADVLVTRLRLPMDQTRSRLVQYWNMADNLAKGAATNAVQILQCLTKP